MNRQTRTYTNSNGAAIEVHEVTEETQGTVQRVDGSGYEVRKGDLIVAQGNPNFWETVSAETLSGYTTDEKPVDTDSDDSAGDSADDFEPSEHRAAEVRAYLSDRADAGDRANFDRVTASEQAGHNRKSAYSEW